MKFIKPQPKNLNKLCYYTESMPIGFDTQSHGVIPVGFFNIDTDMLLINNYFIFASDLCQAISDWTKGADDIDTNLKMYVIEDEQDMGNLMGAISGIVFTGFIGEVYKLYPFPKAPEDFRQKPEGDKTQEQVEKLIKKFGKQKKIQIKVSKGKQTIAIGEYIFKKESFHEVILYIWRGGMPMWRDDEQPKYVKDMMKAVLSSKHWLFQVSVENMK
jgi:hypothetical protein